MTASSKSSKPSKKELSEAGKKLASKKSTQQQKKVAGKKLGQG